MYRSNDIVSLDEYSIYLRPFVKVGEPAENVKVLRYFVKDDYEEENEEDGPDGHGRGNLKRIGEFFKNIFSKHPKFTTKPLNKYKKG